MLTPKDDVDIAELIYYAPAFVLSVYVTWRHGFGRQLGWIFLIILSLLRIIGASTGIVASNNPSTGLIETSAITGNVGLTPLLLAMLGILQRVNEGMADNRGIRPRIFRLIQLPAGAGLALAVIGGIKSFDPHPNTRATGHDYQRAAILLFLAVFILEVGINALSYTKIHYIIPGEKRLLLATGLSIPFLAVRLVYSLISVFNPTSSTFGFQAQSKTSAIVLAFMAILMEFVVVALYLAVGFSVPVISRSQVQPRRRQTHGGVGGGEDDHSLSSVPQQFKQNTSYQGAQQQGAVYEPQTNEYGEVY